MIRPSRTCRINGPVLQLSFLDIRNTSCYTDFKATEKSLNCTYDTTFFIILK